MEEQSHYYGGRGRGRARGGGRGRGGRGGFQHARPFHQNTIEQQIKFLDTEENVCKVMIKHPIKCKINDKLFESHEYCTDINIRHINKELAKKKLMIINNRSFVKNGILNSYGKPHNVYSFFQAMNSSSFLIVEGTDTEIIIKIHPDYKDIIAEKRSYIEKFSKKNRVIQEQESSSSSSEDDEEEDEEEDHEEEDLDEEAEKPKDDSLKKSNKESSSEEEEDQ